METSGPHIKVVEATEQNSNQLKFLVLFGPPRASLETTRLIRVKGMVRSKDEEASLVWNSEFAICG